MPMLAILRGVHMLMAACPYTHTEAPKDLDEAAMSTPTIDLVEEANNLGVWRFIPEGF